MTQNKSILPPNASPLLHDFEDVATARHFLLQNNVLRYMTNPDQCPTHILPWLAWAMSVDIWNNDWSDATKRSVIRQSLQVHKLKGTIGALKRTLSSFLFADIKVEEWFEYGGAPFTFRVYAKLFEDGHSLHAMGLVFTAIMQAKNLRSHLEKFLPQIETINERPRMAITFGHIDITTIYPREQ
jgi:phage tail P2-like protein